MTTKAKETVRMFREARYGGIAVAVVLAVILAWNHVSASDRNYWDQEMEFRALHQENRVLRAQIFCLTPEGRAIAEMVRKNLEKALPTADAVSEKLCNFEIIRHDGVHVKLLVLSENEARAHVHNEDESRGELDFASAQNHFSYFTEDALRVINRMDNPYRLGE